MHSPVSNRAYSGWTLLFKVQMAAAFFKRKLAPFDTRFQNFRNPVLKEIDYIINQLVKQLKSTNLLLRLVRETYHVTQSIKKA